MAKRKKQIVSEDDFESLDRLAHGITLENTRPLNRRERQQWQEARPGRPPKAPGTKSVPTLITVEPRLLKLVDARAKRSGVSRSQFFADAARRRLGMTG